MLQLRKVKIIYVIAFLLTIFFPIQTFAAVEDLIPTPTGSIYVQDPSHHLSEATKQQIIEQSRITYEKTSAQIGFLLVDSLKDYSIEDFSVAALRKYGLGTEGKDNGVLVVIAVEDRQARIEVGYGLEGAIPDGKAGRMLDEYMIPALKENNYDKAVTEVNKAITRAVLQEYGIESDTANTPARPIAMTWQEKATYTGAGIGFLVLLFIIWKVFTRNMSRQEKSHLLMLIIQIIISMIGRGGGGNGGGRGNDRGGGGSSGGGGASRKW